MAKVRWGILSTAKIGTAQVVPAMQRGQYSDVTAISSRNREQAQAAATKLDISKAYGSYEELLADPDIDAVYNPLPNHLHVPWSIKALQAGKHVLCEKPISLTAAETQTLLDAANQHPNLKVMEAFMYRFHPQWQQVKEVISRGGIGELRTINSFFSYFNNDPNNIRNDPTIGGGGLMDIGCYNISLSRFIFGAEPHRVCGLVEYDPQFNTDRLASGMLDFGTGTATFTCSTQLVPYQRVNIFGTTGRIDIEIPFNPPTDKPCRIWHQHGSTLDEITTETANHYTLQGDAFSQAILNNTAVPTPLDDALHNMQVIEAIVRSAHENGWVELPTA